MITSIIIVTILLYVGILFAAAVFVERKYAKGKNLTDNAVIFTLALAIYCTTWTYFGNVGLAVTNGYLYLAVYLGPTLMMLLGIGMFKKLVTIKNKYGTTSIADFISARYGNSNAVAALATLIVLAGIMPYIALQFKATFSAFSLITNTSNPAAVTGNSIDLLVVVLMIVFTIMFGFRKLDMTERHPGMVMVVAIQSIVKLVAFVAIGVFVSYFLYDGIGDLFGKLSADKVLLQSLQVNTSGYSVWFSYIILSMSAILFLPRQFHMAVVENSSTKHFRTVLWLLPLYFILFTFFVFPIAMGGLLEHIDVGFADSFVLLLPLLHNKIWLSILVFVGGFSAALSMVMVCTMTIVTMISNHLVTPILEKVSMLSFLKKRLLLLRWILVVFVIGIGYWFETKVGSSYMLVKIGMVSFAAVFQFAPSIIGGLYWKRGNRVGALMGLSAGFAVWAYSSLLPTFVESGWIATSLLTEGPFGIGFLRPEKLFYVSNLDPLAVVVIFSMLFNVGFYILGSLFGKTNEADKKSAENFVAVYTTDVSLGKENLSQEKNINMTEKKKLLVSIFTQYLKEVDAEALASECFDKVGIKEDKMTLKELLELNSIAERSLTGFIGAAPAREILSKSFFITRAEAENLSKVYTEIIAELKLSPQELAEKISSYQEKEKILQQQSRELEEMVKIRTKELEKKNKELEEFNTLTIGRELKMVELKKEMKKLTDKLSENKVQE